MASAALHTHAIFRIHVSPKDKTETETEAQDAAAPDPKAVEAIGRALAAHYADLVQAPLPDKFMELLTRLEVGVPVSEPKRRRDALG
jgi:hypothetical protein